MATYKMQREYSGCYRIHGPNGYYSNIRKESDGWHADIRKPDGTLTRYAGIWKTLRDAGSEAGDILLTYK